MLAVVVDDIQLKSGIVPESRNLLRLLPRSLRPPSSFPSPFLRALQPGPRFPNPADEPIESSVQQNDHEINNQPPDEYYLGVSISAVFSPAGRTNAAVAGQSTGRQRRRLAEGRSYHGGGLDGQTA